MFRTFSKYTMPHSVNNQSTYYKVSCILFIMQHCTNYPINFLKNLPTQSSQNKIHYEECTHQDKTNKIQPGPARSPGVINLTNKKNKINKKEKQKKIKQGKNRKERREWYDCDSRVGDGTDAIIKILFFGIKKIS